MCKKEDLLNWLARLQDIENKNTSFKRDRATSLVSRLNRTEDTQKVTQMLVTTMLLYLEES